MKVVRKSLSLGREAYFSKCVALSDLLLGLGLTAGEQRVLSAFLSLGGGAGMFSSANRGLVARRLGMGRNGVGNHLMAMLEKGVLLRGEGGGISVPGHLVPPERGLGYMVRLDAEG